MTSLRRIALLATGETFGRGMAWLTVFVLPWILGAHEYGLVVLLATFEGVATGVLLLGQDSAIFWRCARHEDPDEARACVTGAMLVTFTACLLALIACSGAALATGGSILGVPIWPHVWLLAVGVTLGNVNRIALAFARASGRTRDFVIDRGAVGSGRFAFTIGSAALSGSALSFPIGMALGTAAGGLWLCRSFLLKARRLGAAVAEIRPLLRFGAPLSVHLLAMNVINLVDRWVIAAVIGVAAVGSYGWYYMLGSGVVFVFSALSVSYEPEIYREYQQRADTRSLREYLGVSIAAAGAYGLVGSGVAVVGSGLVPDSVRADPAIAAIVLLAHWFRPIYVGANYLLSSVGRTLRVAGISAATVVATVLAAVLLVPSLGPIGGAWATLIGAVVLVVSALVAARRLSMPVDVLIRPTLVIAAAGCVVIAWMSISALALSSAGLILYGVVSSGLPGRIREMGTAQ